MLVSRDFSWISIVQSHLDSSTDVYNSLYWSIHGKFCHKHLLTLCSTLMETPNRIPSIWTGRLTMEDCCQSWLIFNQALVSFWRKSAAHSVCNPYRCSCMLHGLEFHLGCTECKRLQPYRIHKPLSCVITTDCVNKRQMKACAMSKLLF